MKTETINRITMVLATIFFIFIASLSYFYHTDQKTDQKTEQVETH